VNVVKEIEAIAAREALSDAPYLSWRIGEAITATLGPGEGDGLEKLIRQYVVRIGGQVLVTDSENLTWMRTLDIAAAPELLALIPARNLFVLVGQYWACTDEQLLEVDRTIDFTPEASARFYRDMVTLADQGKYQPYAGRGDAHWRIGATSGTIVLRSWTALSPLPPDERAAVLQRIDRKLAEHRKSD
jgi:hypothetical protein